MSNPKTVRMAVLACAALLLLALPFAALAANVNSMILSLSEVKIAVNGSVKLEATVLPEDADDKEVIWASGDTSIATVSHDGVVKGIAPGTVTILAIAHGNSDITLSCTVTVGTPVKSITVEPSSATLKTGAVLQASVQIKPKSASVKDVIWSSTDPSIASVSSSGKIQAWSAGKVTITATAKDGSGVKGTCKITVKKGSSTATPSPTPKPSNTAWVNTNEKGLNMRTGPGTSYARRMVIPQYATVTVLSKGSTWCHVTYDGRTGYVMTSFLSFSGKPPVTPKPKVTPTPKADSTAWVNTNENGLNFRKGPGTSYPRIRVIPQYATVAVLSKGAEWCHISYDGDTGYVMTKYLSFKGKNPGKKTPTPKPSGQKAWVDTDGSGLNLRSGPGTGYARILVMPQYAPVTILVYGSSWSYIRYGSDEGYAMTQYLHLGTTKKTPAPTGAGKGYARVTTANGGSLNLRAGTSTSSQIITTIPNGTLVKVRTYGPSWCYVDYSGVKGFVMTSYLTVY